MILPEQNSLEIMVICYKMKYNQINKFEVYSLNAYAGRQGLTNADINKSDIKAQLDCENIEKEKGMIRNDKISYLCYIRY